MGSGTCNRMGAATGRVQTQAGDPGHSQVIYFPELKGQNYTCQNTSWILQRANTTIGCKLTLQKQSAEAVNRKGWMGQRRFWERSTEAARDKVLPKSLPHLSTWLSRMLGCWGAKPMPPDNPSSLPSTVLAHTDPSMRHHRDLHLAAPESRKLHLAQQKPGTHTNVE